VIQLNWKAEKGHRRVKNLQKTEAMTPAYAAKAEEHNNLVAARNLISS
jgi:uncharacterized protein YeaO (DUF488 family)